MYGLKLIGAVFREFLSERLEDMGFKSSIIYMDAWIEPTTKTDGDQYYKFILMYVDYLLEIIQDAVSVIRKFA